MPVTPNSSAAGPVDVYAGPANRSAETGITSKVAIEGMRIEDKGILTPARASIEFFDRGLAYEAIRGNWKIITTHGSTTTFRGFVETSRNEIRGIYGGRIVDCVDLSSLLDRLIVNRYSASGPPLRRTNGESDKARIQWLVDQFGQPLVAEGLNDWSKTRVLNSNMPDQSFKPGLTLRQAIERVLSAASDSANYYIDHRPRLHTFDEDNPENDFAPYSINVAATPGSGAVAPERLEATWDTSALINGYWVNARTKAASGFYTDQDLLSGPWSVNLFGPRYDSIDAPDADTDAKAQRVAKAALRDTRNPMLDLTMTLAGTSVLSGTHAWSGGERFYITSAVHGLNGSGTDAGPIAGSSTASIQPFRTLSVVTTYLNGVGDRQVGIQAGRRRLNLYKGGPA